MTVVLDILKQDEGFRADPYKCPAGRWTIGYGRNFEDNPFSLKELVHILHISEAQAEWLLWNTVNEYTQTLEKFGVDVSAHTMKSVRR